MSPQRQVLRYLFGVSATLSDRQGTATFDVNIHNMSFHGCCVQGDEVLAQGERRVLTIHWRGTEIRIQAEVIWADAEGRAGFKFHTIEKGSRALLGELCTMLRIQSAVPVSREGA